MVRDLTAVGYSMVKLEMQEAMKVNAQDKVEEALLDLLLPGSGKKKDSQKSANQAMLPLTIFGTDAVKAAESDGSQTEPAASHGEDMAVTREKFRQWLKEGKLEEKQVEVTVQKQQKMPAMEIFAGGNMEDIESTMQNITSMLTGARTKKKTVTVKEAREILLEEHLDKMIDPDKVADEARSRVEQMGIIFIDEIDKIARRGSRGGAQDVSREGVQRDTLP